MRGVLQGFLVAIAFLTVIPVPFGQTPSAAAVARSRFWYPVVGLFLGALLAGMAALLARLNAAPVAAFLVVVFWVALTGALHLDGFCDLCDGLFGGDSPEERLGIMKDPHLGTFALAGGALLMLGKFAALELAMASPARAAWLTMAAVTWARCLALCMAADVPYPRLEGTGKSVVEATHWGEAALITAVLALLLCLTAPSPWITLALLFFTLVVAMGLRAVCVLRLGGITGDCLGAGIEMTELLFLTTAVLFV